MNRHDLSTPRPTRRIGVHYDPDAFGQFSEGVARFIGTARFLVFQSVVIVVWISFNAIVPFDGSQLQLLTLLLSLQAAYAAPLILLAQSRQEDRDRTQTETDRDINARTQADTEFLARELASVRLVLSDVVTTEDLRDHLSGLVAAVERLARKVDSLDPQDVAPGQISAERRRGRAAG
ncbi:MAG: DUF1003 domain-containing protein [Acidimicrobiia bacterium]